MPDTPPSALSDNRRSGAEDMPPYRVQIEFIAQEAVLGGWHDVASTTDLQRVGEMLAAARCREKVNWNTGRRERVEIRLVRRVTTWQTYPEPTGGLVGEPILPVDENAPERAKLDNHYGYCTLPPDHDGPCGPVGSAPEASS